MALLVDPSLHASANVEEPILRGLDSYQSARPIGIRSITEMIAKFAKAGLQG